MEGLYDPGDRLAVWSWQAQIFWQIFAQVGEGHIWLCEGILLGVMPGWLFCIFCVSSQGTKWEVVFAFCVTGQILWKRVNASASFFRGRRSTL